jgi:transposase-like protein
MSRKRLQVEDKAEALYWLICQNASIDAVMQLYGIGRSTLRNWRTAVLEGSCFSDGGIGPDGAETLQDAFNACLVRHGHEPMVLPRPLLMDRITAPQSTQPRDATEADTSAPETSSLREVLSLRKINAMSGRVEDLDKRVALLETTAAKWLPVIANLCSELGIEVPADEEASAWQTHC